jgi:YVTN family beta-propeller protein
MASRFAALGLLACLGGCSQLPAAQRLENAAATVSSPIAMSPDGRTVWVVNPDADSVTPIDAGSLKAGPPRAVGREPWGVAATASGLVVVLNRADGTVSLLEGRSRTTIPVGPEPGGFALARSGSAAYVTVSGSDEVVTVDLSRRSVAKRVAVGRQPWSIAAAPWSDTETLIVSHRLARLRTGGEEGINDGKEGWLSLLQGERVTEIPLRPYVFGFVNGLEGLAVSGETVLVAHLLDRPAGPRDFQHTVSAAVTTIDLSAGEELEARRIHLNESTFSTPVNLPRAVALSPDARTAYVVLAGSDAVMGIDLSTAERPRLVGFWPTGRSPRGIALDREGSRAYVMNYLSRDVSVLDLRDTSRRPVLATIAVAPETLDPELLRGKVLFNKANDPRLSRLGWMSCASCHLDGGVDGTTWLGPDGPRQTQPLWNLAGTAPFHASATRDEVQDVERDIETLMGGVGLAPGRARPELGEPNGGRSNDLDSLARFVLEGIRVPRSAAITSQQEERGRQVFRRAGCPQCHAGPHWTVSALPATIDGSRPEVASALRDVGTTNPNDVLGRSGFDVPTLLGVGSSAPYLHDGSARSLEDVLKNPRHAPPLSEAEISALVLFLRSIDGETKPIEP